MSRRVQRSTPELRIRPSHDGLLSESKSVRVVSGIGASQQTAAERSWRAIRSAVPGLTATVKRSIASHCDCQLTGRFDGQAS